MKRRSELFVLPSSISKLFLSNGTENPNVDNIDYYPRHLSPSQGNLHIINANTSTLGEDSFGNLVAGWNPNQRNYNLVTDIVNNFPRHMLQNLVVIAGKDGSVIPVAGSYFTKMMDHEPGTIEPFSCLITDENGEIPNFAFNKFTVTDKSGSLLAADNAELKVISSQTISVDINENNEAIFDLALGDYGDIIVEETTNNERKFVIDSDLKNQITNSSVLIGPNTTLRNSIISGSNQSNSRIYYSSSICRSTGGTITVVADNAHYIPICLSTLDPIRQIRTLVQASASGNCKMGLYSDNNGKPGDKLFETSSLTVQSALTYTTAAVNWTPPKRGWHWMSIVFSSTPTLFAYDLNTQLTFQGVINWAGTGRQCFGEREAVGSYSLPTTANSRIVDNTLLPVIEISFTP
jgi:hypothetical protein